MTSTTERTRAGVRRAGRYLGTTMVVVGLALLTWSGVVWKWGDPFTALYTTWEQRKLDDELTGLIAERRAGPRLITPTTKAPTAVRLVRKEAARFRGSVRDGHAIGRLKVPRLGVNMVVVEGTGSDELKRGPGRDDRTFMPGEGKLVYLAGHRTTYSAPFARIDRLRPGDTITIEMPYGVFVYSVTRHRIVDDQDLSVLRSGSKEEVALQACHPRFFATQRYIVWATPVRKHARDRRLYALPQAVHS